MSICITNYTTGKLKIDGITAVRDTDYDDTKPISYCRVQVSDCIMKP